MKSFRAPAIFPERNPWSDEHSTVSGKPYQQAVGFDIRGAADAFRYYAGWADKVQGSVIETTPEKLAYTIREPVGVCGQIIPYVGIMKLNSLKK